MHLLVLPLNAGQPDNDMSVFDKGAFNKIRQYQNIVDGLEVAFDVPVFPRPAKHGLVYTHALDRDSLLTAVQGLQRLNKQLLAMIDSAILPIVSGQMERRKQSPDDRFFCPVGCLLIASQFYIRREF